jgi:hypothetical protein
VKSKHPVTPNVWTVSRTETNKRKQIGNNVEILSK